MNYMTPKLTLLPLFLQGIPESIALAAVAFVFANLRLDWKKAILIGVVQGITAYLVRMLPVSFGIHSIILMFTLGIYLKIATKASLFTVFKSSALAFMILLFAEVLSNITLFNLINLSFEDAVANTFVWILLGWPQILIMFIIAWVRNRYQTGKKGISF